MKMRMRHLVNYEKFFHKFYRQEACKNFIAALFRLHRLSSILLHHLMLHD